MATLTGRTLTPELMDDPGVSTAELAEALAFLRRINRRLGGTRASVATLARWARHLPVDRPIRILDVGTGSADIPLAMARWAERAGRVVRIDAVDAHAGTLAVARTHVGDCPSIRLVEADATALGERYEPRSFDVTHAALFLHHLTDVRVLTVLAIMNRLTRRGLIWSDLLRNPIARLGVRVATMGAGRLARHDGRVSVEAGFTRGEASDLARRAGLERVRVRTSLFHRFLLTSERVGER